MFWTRNKIIVPVLSIDGSRVLIQSGVATGGMQAKLNAATSAVESGVQEVSIVKGSDSDIILRLFAGERIGTRITA